ncbi:hypothetical protein [uncultured Photobacterium sp.]|uniref:hypothetical protein n=1 Tax=uncultured Photobacterium sp. TaxID=173973 RepID=UPI0026139D77|nr:hypothetical protein [uncultured Photobacterium sp.]
MQLFCKLIPSSALTHRELDYILTPDECLGQFSRARRVQDVLGQLPRPLSETLSLSAKKDLHSLLNGVKQQLVRGHWVALSSFARRSSLTDTQLSQYPSLKKCVERVQATQAPKAVKANYKPVTDDVVLASNLTFDSVEPSPEYKIVVEFAGQWPNNAASLMLGKTEVQSEKIARPRKDMHTSHRSTAVFKNLEPEPKNLYLTVPMNGSPQPLKLKLAENIQPIDKETEKDEWDNVLVPVRPLAYLDGSKDKNKAAELKGGYLYLFWKNKLWREFYITDRGYYQDIDVEYHRQVTAGEAEKEQSKILKREPDGFPLAQFWVPYKIMGEVQQGDNGLKVCFSPKQKTFEQIEALEADSEKLGKVSTPLDELGCYSDSKAFSVQEHISDVDSAAIHTVTDDDMPWLSELPTVVRSFDQSNTVITYVDGHNDGFLVRLETVLNGDYLGREPELYAVMEDTESEWRISEPFEPSEDAGFIQALISGIPRKGKFTLLVVNPADPDGAELVFKDLTYEQVCDEDFSIEESEVVESYAPDEDVIEKQKAYQNMMSMWHNMLVS